MRQNQQLGDFKPSTKDKYDEVVCEDKGLCLYFHKVGFPNVMVRAPNARKKIHCWRLKTIEVTQYASVSGARQKATAKIEFDGELIFTLIEQFNQMMGKQILQYVEKITHELRAWCVAPIKNVFLLNERVEGSLGFKHGFLEVKPVLFYIDRCFYFEYRCWEGELESEIDEIEKAEMVEGTSSYTGVFDYVCQKIAEEKKARLALKKKKMEEKKEKSAMGESKIENEQNYEDSIHPVKWKQDQMDFGQ